MIIDVAESVMPVRKVESKEDLKDLIVKLSPGIDRRGKNVLSEINLHWFRGIPSWVQYFEGEPVTLICAYFGRRKANVWSPYMNSYTIFTRADVRRRGFASRLMMKTRELAVQAGCRRMKDLAGTSIGYLFHRSIGDDFWAWTPQGSLMIDIPLIDPSNFPENTTPIAARKWTNRTTPMTEAEIQEIIQSKKFAYDE